MVIPHFPRSFCEVRRVNSSWGGFMGKSPTNLCWFDDETWWHSSPTHQILKLGRCFETKTWRCECRSHLAKSRCWWRFSHFSIFVPYIIFVPRGIAMKSCRKKPFCWIWWWYHWTFEANRCRKIHVHFAKEGCDLHPEDSGKVEDPTARGATDWYRSMEGSQVMEVPQNRHPVMDDHDLVLKQPWWLGVRPQISYTTSCKTSIFLQILKNSYTFSYKSSNFHGSAIDFSWTKLFFSHIFSIKFPWTKMIFY